MSDEVAIAINSRARDVVAALDLAVDPDFTKAFAQMLSNRLARGEPIESAIERAFQTTKAGLLSRGAQDAHRFKREVLLRMSTVVAVRRVFDILADFKKYAERQLAHGFQKNPNEEFCRSNLQSYLEQAGRTVREVTSGGGLIDVVAATGEPIETKLWRGKENSEAGVEELREYMRTESQDVGYYVVFDNLIENQLLKDEVLNVPEGRIYQFAVRVRPGQPSTSRQRRRKSVTEPDG